jgi:precorrin-3B synthase
VSAAVRERGDGCPGALRLHVADDGRLARLRLPAGLLTARQAEALADAAERLGDGHLDITSRGNVQLRGLAASCGGELAELLHEAGLLPSEKHERVRNIVASPLAGLDGLGAGDVRSWAARLDALLCASDAAATLSGRFLFALDDGRGDVATLGADVTLLAQQDGTATVHTGANRSALRVSATDAPRAALLAAETFLTMTEASGSGAWRVRELPAEHRRRLQDAVAARLAEAGVPTEYAADLPLPEGEPPRPGLISSSGRSGPVSLSVPLSVPLSVSLSVQTRLGRLSAAQWRLLLGGNGTLRLTPWRGVILPSLDPATAPSLMDRLRTAGLITGPDSPWLGVGACTGRPGCGKALTDVRSDAAGSVSASRGGLPVYWSGCARRCGHPQGDRVEVVATAEGGYRVSVRKDREGREPRDERKTRDERETPDERDELKDGQGPESPPATAAPGAELTEAVATARTSTKIRAQT